MVHRSEASLVVFPTQKDEAKKVKAFFGKETEGRLVFPTKDEETIQRLINLFFWLLETKRD